MSTWKSAAISFGVPMRFGLANPLPKDPSLGAVPGEFATQVIVSGRTTFLGGLGIP